MKRFYIFLLFLTVSQLGYSQNVGIGITTPTENLHVVGNKSLFDNTFVGIGVGAPVSPFTHFQIKKNNNSWVGMYIDAGATGQPFYGYALNGVATAYHQFNGTTGQFEYFHSNPSVPDFQIANTTAAFPHTNFLGIGTTTPTTGFTGLTLKSSANTFYGAYVDAGLTGTPFYGYALNGTAVAYTTYSGPNNQFEYHHTTDASPDFQISNTTAAFPHTNFLGIGTTTPTTGFTGLALKSSANNFYGAYVDAGATGTPFYGYALNGTAVAYTTYSGVNNQFEYHHTTDASPDFQISNTTAAFPHTNFLGIGTTTPTTGFTGLAIKSSANSFYGAYVDAGVTGTPFYGYALNGTAVAYTTYSGVNNQFEYHHTTDAVPDFQIGNTTAAFPNTNFLGIGTTTPTTGFTGLTLKTTANNFYGAYIDAGATGTPFYGYALNGTAVAYTTFSGPNNQFEYHHTTDATPDFAVSNTRAIFPIQTFIGVGTSTPTNSATGFTLKKNTAGYFGSYIDAGTSGQPFYGYAINGSPVAWTELNSVSSVWEMNYFGPRISVTSGGNVGIGNSTPAAKLDVNGTIHAANLAGGATTLSTDASGNIIRTPSDARLKNKIESINDPLQKVLHLNGVTYNFIDEARFGSNRQMGFLAQDLEKWVPEAVSSGGEYKSVNYQVLTALLAEAIKAQQQELEGQKKENDQLRNELKELLKRIEALEKK